MSDKDLCSKGIYYEFLKNWAYGPTLDLLDDILTRNSVSIPDRSMLYKALWRLHQDSFEGGIAQGRQWEKERLERKYKK